MNLKLNQADVERVIRVVAGGAIVSQVFTGLQTPWAWAGAIFVVTGLVGWCPIYQALGLSTRKEGGA